MSILADMSAIMRCHQGSLKPAQNLPYLPVRTMHSLWRGGICKAPGQFLRQGSQSWSTRNSSLRLISLMGHEEVRAASVATKPAGNESKISDVELTDEMQKYYLNYAMSVIVGRALPDVRDGLKPVHRRILYAMHDLGLSHQKPFRKSARVVGEVLGKYHPHGDTAVYDALVRLAQPFNMRAPLINGHGNFGSQDADPAAAMRYTECRLQEIASAALLADIGYETVAMTSTFDGTHDEPTVLPAKLPFALVNGAEGIAVGMATKIPPHNMREIVAGLKALIENPDITTPELMKHIPAPDFPTGGEILPSPGIAAAYETGSGQVRIAAKARIEDEGRARAGATPKQQIIITELPYQVVKAKLVAHIAEMIGSTDKLEGVANVSDESGRAGMRIVIEIKRGYDAQVALRNLYKHTRLETSFSCNLVALVDQSPQQLGLKDFLSHFLDFRCGVVVKRAKFDLSKAEAREHIVEGLITAQDNLEEVIQKIRKSEDASSAIKDLQRSYGLSQMQADAIVNLTLRRLTSQESAKLEKERKELKSQISSLKSLLESEVAIKDTVAREADEIISKHGEARKSMIAQAEKIPILPEDMLDDKPSLIVYSKRGFVKRMAPDTFSAQGRGGKGTKGANLRHDDSLEDVFQVTDKQTILIFGNDGVCYRIKAHNIPEASRNSAGTSIANIISKLRAKNKPVERGWKPTVFMAIEEEDEDIVVLSKKGFVKRISVQDFLTMRNGSPVITLEEDDELLWARKAIEGNDIMITTNNGLVSRFPLDLFPRPKTRKARGLQALSQQSAKEGICGFAIVPNQGLTATDDISDEESSSSGEHERTEPGPYALIVTKQGYGKRVAIKHFIPRRNRRCIGLTGIQLVKGDQLSAFHVVGDWNDVLVATSNGQIMRTPLAAISVHGRKAKGHVLMRFKSPSDQITSVSVVDSAEDKDKEDED